MNQLLYIEDAVCFQRVTGDPKEAYRRRIFVHISGLSTMTTVMKWDCSQPTPIVYWNFMR